MTPTDATNPKDALGEAKPPLWLVPAAATIYEANVFKLGARKYGPYNWREKKVRATVYLAAALRHILTALDGEDVDPESGQPHLAHARACTGIYLDALATGNLIDDRPTPGAAARVIAETTEKREEGAVNPETGKSYFDGFGARLDVGAGYQPIIVGSRTGGE